MTDRKFRNRVQKIRLLRDEVRKNRFLGTENLGGEYKILGDRSEEPKKLQELNKSMDAAQLEFCEDYQLKRLSNKDEWLGDIVCTKVEFLQGTEWVVADNPKKVALQHKEVNKLTNKMEKLLKKSESNRTLEEELMVNALTGLL
jgi:hypothetical protein